MKAVIMAGGEGTRLKAVTGDMPKPLVRVAGRPVLEHILELLKRNGITEACMALRYRPEEIMSRFGRGERFGMRLSYHIEREALGTAGGVRACLDPRDGRDTLVISGDCVCSFNLRALTEARRRHRCGAVIALHEEPSPLRYGVVLTDPVGRVVSFLEKPDWSCVVSDTVNTGIYVVSAQAMSLVPEGTQFDFSKDLFPLMLRTGLEIRALPLPGYWSDIGTPRDYYRTCLDALDGKIPSITPGATAEAAAVTASAVPPTARSVPCSGRAHVMRLVSQALMEAGADFTGGVTLRVPDAEVRISPDPEDERIIVDARSHDPSRAGKLAEKYEKLVRSLTSGS